MTGYRLKIQSLDEHARAIGYLCMKWAMLEQRMHDCLDQLSAFPDKEVGDCLMAATNMTTKISMLKGVAFMRKRSTKWLDAYSACLHRIDNEMRIKRNRYVHDVWVHHSPIEPPVKRTYSVQIVKPQSHQRKLTTHIDEPITADEIWNFVYQVDRVSTRLALFANFEDQAFAFVETWPEK